ncbi:glycosyltransferase family 4 protein [Catenisphaera adipataccumulans]|jgi:1,2-diacylglycerol-3-alpha-glucose alpha-1,2-galactosyltransferase|uniref:1,2-diacylglycerol-3-alpha-glucose alpha-1,2-galactosyltransferase n=1 Tax=Catenisphaera adipataccumulans TaxID=700500 RepID=A0A7W8FX80_9FIRM|nr:glycosyltransferase family 4 protein [Catenisphaera adipataccumulans]MBB5183430.1 1,2-diacylglycerol-3-alpha-glucose alpha-1,2-galactosyltransferase [Catenisphaera adipataccumulans]
MKDKKLRIIMYSSADKVAGQGVGSAYEEQVRLIKEGASDLFDVEINNWTKKPDIQHFHTVDPTFYAKMQDKKACNIAYCHFLPDTLEGSINIPNYAMKVFSSYVVSFYKSADRLVVVNPSFIDDLVDFGIPRERIYYIPNYVSKDEFYKKSRQARKQLREHFGFKENDFIVFDAGQVQTRKGVLDFVEVAEQLPDIQFVWAGGFSFGKITDGYEELKRVQENPPKNVHFLGIVPREQMNDLYNIADVLFMPSYNELFPMTILEAVNLHVPLVLRDLDLYKDILFDHYLKGDNNTEFKEKIESLYKDKELYAQYQNESKAISDFYSKEHVLSMWREFYLSAYKEKQDALLAKKKNKKKKKKNK